MASFLGVNHIGNWFRNEASHSVCGFFLSCVQIGNEWGNKLPKASSSSALPPSITRGGGMRRSDNLSY